MFACCSGCIEKLVGVDSKCPECGAFAWVKDMKTNRQLANTVAMCAKMRMLLGSDDDINSDDDNDDDELRINDSSPTDTRGIVSIKKNQSMSCSIQIQAKINSIQFKPKIPGDYKTFSAKTPIKNLAILNPSISEPHTIDE